MAQLGLERLVWDQEVGGSNPPAPTKNNNGDKDRKGLALDH
jgi:hypothetical protein